MHLFIKYKKKIFFYICGEKIVNECNLFIYFTFNIIYNIIKFIYNCISFINLYLFIYLTNVFAYFWYNSLFIYLYNSLFTFVYYLLIYLY